MSRDIFREGGPHNIHRNGPDSYSMSVSLPVDENGRTARECPNAECSPGYFKVKGGTEITGGQERAFCLYCRYEAEPNDFVTKEQLRYAKDLLVQEAHKGVEVKPAETLAFTRDLADNKFLECALTANAPLLVTGNTRHFPRQCKGVQVITPRVFFTLLVEQLPG